MANIVDLPGSELGDLWVGLGGRGRDLNAIGNGSTTDWLCLGGVFYLVINGPLPFSP